MKNKRYFTNPLTIEKFETGEFSGEDWPLAFSTGSDGCNGKEYAVTTDHVPGSMVDGVCAAELAFLFEKSIVMYNLIKDLIKNKENGEIEEVELDILELKELIEDLEEKIEVHRRENI